MEAALKKNLEEKAREIRKLILLGVYSANSGHPGGSLSCADVMASLYFHEMKVDEKDPNWEDRDRFVLSKGHCSPALYATLALRGFFSTDEIPHFREYGYMLQGHPDKNLVPGVDMSSGSLGQGISAACGMALSGKISNKSYRVYSVLGDGELEEGQVWEAAMFAAQYKLDNLCAIVDFNGLQIDGELTSVCSPLPIAEKYAAFNWNVLEIDGHNIEEILNAFEKAKQTKGKPTVIVAHTTKGKGVSFMENVASWHGSAPNEEQFNQAMQEFLNA